MRDQPRLPLDIQSFEEMRHGGYLYVDKTAFLQKMVEEGKCYFLHRPRRFGKTVMLSTLEAMFLGKKELFQGLSAEAWVNEQAEHPSCVLHLDMSSYGTDTDVERLDSGICSSLKAFLRKKNVPFEEKADAVLLLNQAIDDLYNAFGSIVILIDEYDCPVVNALDDVVLAEKLQKRLQSLYSVLKSFSNKIRFLMITGISKFVKMGIFSSLNILRDISLDSDYGSLLGYTQEEIEQYFDEYIRNSKASFDGFSSLKDKIKFYYDGYSFDGEHHVYNPFSLLYFFKNDRFENYWYSSGTPQMLFSYLKKYKIDRFETFHSMYVPRDFTEGREMISEKPENLLYQTGYLTIKQVLADQSIFVLDYPNYEVETSLKRDFYEYIYHVNDLRASSFGLWNAIRDGDIEKILSIYNTTISHIPSIYFANADEAFYKSIFITLLQGLGVWVDSETSSSIGTSDIVLKTARYVFVFEFKVIKTTVKRAREDALRQIETKGYLEPYASDPRDVRGYAICIDKKKRKVFL